ncbi:hypothetical protein [Streptomyces sulphureus]|uniref:hypothetical protein n=1 Tax=Streptomyces sulphureus TaxID=47758 RepID=UPI000365FB76|nr:hypothetical protein [Streptomyces sulphureus]
MARTSTARIIAAAASVPLAVTLMSGIAQADDGAVAGLGSNASVSEQGQVAGGEGNNTNQANNATVNGDGNLVKQDNTTTNVEYTVVITNLWR